MTLIPTTRTAAEWEEMAIAAERRSAESFERCDTDGFLSQAAADASASMYHMCADIVRDGGTVPFLAVADLDGNLLDAREVKTRYGYAFRVAREDGTVDWFHPSEARKGARRKANDAKKGYTFMLTRVPAVVDLTEGGWTAYARRDLRSNVAPVVIGPAEYEDWD